MQNKLVICLFGDYDPNYSRQVVIKRGLEKNGIKVLECNCFLKHSNSKYFQIYNKPLYLIKAYSNLLRKFQKIDKTFSFFIVTHNNYLIAPLVFFLAKRYNKKFILDAFDPAYLTAQMKHSSVPRCFFIKLIENIALKLPHYILVTTEEFKKLYLDIYNLNPKKFIILPVGANEDKFYPRGKVKNDSIFRVIYWGNFHPHHGVDIIIEAAQRVQNHKEIKFILVGGSKYLSSYQKMAGKMRLKNIEFIGRVSDKMLIDYIKNADVCLGIFSSHKLALASVTNKVFEGMAMGKPVITERNLVTSSWFTNRKETYLVPPEDSRALAEAVLELRNNEILRHEISRKAAKLFHERFSEKVIGKTFSKFLKNNN